MNKINIHFVCRGGIYRSRLAEAYLRSLDQKEIWNISSSGICAEKHNLHLTISPRTVRIAANENLSKYLTQVKTQTSNQVLDGRDLIIFMSKDVFRDAKRSYNFNDKICLVWNVKDVGDWPKELPSPQKSQKTYRQVRKRVNQLFKDISSGSWVDIVDEHNGDLGFKLPITIANKKSLWHRGCHAIITTPDHRTLVQQRSKSIIFAPNLVDVTLGGHVDTGETPEQAILREIKEEIGLIIDPTKLQLLEMSKWNKYHPRYKLHAKTFIYTYHVPIAENNPAIIIQEEEVQSVKFLTPAKLKRLIVFRTLARVGRLNYSYAYYSRIIKLSEKLNGSKL
jgi:protein-tyrosine-phosphatase/8-oxo-dGTP pyrophosphatase MutT (NUDIX family)